MLTRPARRTRAELLLGSGAGLRDPDGSGRGARPGRHRHHPRHRHRQQRRRHARRDGHGHAGGDRAQPRVRDRRQRRVHGAVDPDGHLHDQGRTGRLQVGDADRHPPERRPAGAHRRQARGRRADRVGRDRREHAAGAVQQFRPVDDGAGRADQGAAAQRPQLREPDPHDPRRDARHPRLEHRRRRQPGVARVGGVLGQRPAPARQQLHARRRRQQRDVAADGGDLPERRRHRRVQAADQHLFGRVRQVARRRRQPPDQVRRQPVPRQRVRVPAQRRLRRQQLLQQPGRPPEAGLRPGAVRRHVRRAPRARPDVLLRRLPGPAHRGRPDLPLDRALACACATATSARSTASSTTRSRSSRSRTTSSRAIAGIRRRPRSSRSSTPSRTPPARSAPPASRSRTT